MRPDRASFAEQRTAVVVAIAASMRVLREHAQGAQVCRMGARHATDGRTRRETQHDHRLMDCGRVGFLTQLNLEFEVPTY